MGVYKEGKNWKVQVYYKDWQGNQKRKQKRGFRTKGEAKEWERDFLKLDLYKEKEEAARRELNEYQIYISHLHNEVNLNKEELKLALSSYSREEILYKKGLVSANLKERTKILWQEMME